MKNIIVIIFALTLFCSCIRMDRHPIPKGISITKENIRSINGIYNNFENDKCKNFNYSFWYQLMVSIPDKFNISHSSLLKLEVINEKQIQVSLIQNNNIISTGVINYKLKNNELYIKTTRQIKGIPPVIWSLFLTKSRLNFKSNNEINCHTFSISSWYFLAIGLPADYWNNYIFKKDSL